MPLRLKPLVVAAIISAAVFGTFITANAVTQGALVRFIIGGEQVEGEYYDYVDEEGFRRVRFGATMPLYEQNYAVVFDVDATEGENVRVMTPDSDPEFFKNLGDFLAANDAAWESAKENAKLPKPEDFGIVFKDSEFCEYHVGYLTEREGFNLRCGSLGGKFFESSIEAGKPYGVNTENQDEPTFDYENKTQTQTWSFYYYVGK